LQRRSINQAESSEVPPIVNEVLPEFGQPLDTETLAFRKSSFEHDFSKIRVYSTVPKMIQPKFYIGLSGDRYEQEAARVAEEVMWMPPSIQGQINPGEGEEEEIVQKKAIANQVTPLEQQPESTQAPPSVQAVLRSPGQPLDPVTRDFMELRFGYDFSQVRVHTNAKARESAGAIDAAAYTVGSNIVFGTGKSPGKDKLTAHELTHVLQQGKTLNQNRATIVQRDRNKESASPVITREEILRDLRQRIIERAVDKTIEICEALQNGYIWPEFEVVPGTTLTVEVIEQWTERNQTLQQLLLWLGDFIQRLEAGESYHDLLDPGTPGLERQVQEGTYLSPRQVAISFLDEALVYLENVHSLMSRSDEPRWVFIRGVLLSSPNRTSVLPPSLRTGQAVPTTAPSEAPPSQPRGPRRATSHITDLWVEVQEPYAHPDRVIGTLTALAAGFRPVDRPSYPRFELLIVGGRFCYNRGDRLIWLPNLPEDFPSLREEFRERLREPEP
jgi:hypothetical protein